MKDPIEELQLDFEVAELNVASLIAENTKLKAQVKQMTWSVDFLDCLHGAGVDNWVGYEMAQETMSELYPDEEE